MHAQICVSHRDQHLQYAALIFRETVFVSHYGLSMHCFVVYLRQVQDGNVSICDPAAAWPQDWASSIRQMTCTYQHRKGCVSACT